MFTEHDVRLLDMMTHAYHNFILINDINQRIMTDGRANKKSPVTQFYFEWCDKRIPEDDHPLPVNRGTMWMLASVVILNCSPRWLKYLPNTRISQAAPEWGFKLARLSYPEDPDPNLRKVIRKIRNAIAHSRFTLHIEDIWVPWKVLINETTFTFKDRDDFEIEISVADLSKLSATIYLTMSTIIGEHMRIQDEV